MVMSSRLGPVSMACPKSWLHLRLSRSHATQLSIDGAWYLEAASRKGFNQGFIMFVNRAEGVSKRQP